MNRWFLWCISVICLITAGCYSVKFETEPLPPFFTCYRWIDADHDNRVAKSEVEGLNRPFYSTYQTVCFMGEINEPFGTTLSWELHGPDGSVNDRGTSLQLDDVMVHRNCYSVKDLVAAGGAGTWTMEWLVKEVKVGMVGAELVEQ